jgi:RNA polymerase sigma-70 factor (ECF subfamily)
MSTDSALRVPHIEILVRGAQAGDRGAFEELVRRYERQIIARFIGSVPSSDTAEDLAQETFVRAWVHLKSLRDPSSFGPWLFGIAGNVHKEWAKDRTK